MHYEVYLFLEIIESVQGIQFLREEHDELGNKARAYQGLQGQLVIIDISDEYIGEIEGTAHLRKLGLSHLIDAMFPPEKKKEKIPVKTEEEKG